MDDNDKIYKCPFCSVEKGFRGLACHVSKAHKGAIEPRELHILLLHGGKHPLCKCGCGQEVSWLQSKFGEYLRGHNGFSDEARIKAVEVRSERCAAGEISSWNAGLTKETDQRVADTAAKISATNTVLGAAGKLSEWRNDEEKHEQAKIRSSITNKAQFASGERVAWAKGLTKEIDPRLMELSKVIRASRLTSDKVRLSPDEYVRRIADYGNDNLILESDPSEYRTKYSKLSFRCKSCGHRMRKTLAMLKITPNFCSSCAPRESEPQLEIFRRVSAAHPDALLSDREVLGNGMELDVYVPSRAFAVEYNGLIWHSEKMRRATYHQEKHAVAKAKGVRILDVFSDEWKADRELAESIVDRALDVCLERVPAGRCSTELLSADERAEFFEACCLDGDSPASLAVGLFDGDDLVAAMSSVTSGVDFRVVRYAEAPGYRVLGAQRKLLEASACEHGLKRASWTEDGRHAIGADLIAGGGSLTSATEPMFWWTDFDCRYPADQPPATIKETSKVWSRSFDCYEFCDLISDFQS